jgi:MOSC domain-containing protein YiiM
MPVVVSIQVGQPTKYIHVRYDDGKQEAWTTAFFKAPVTGPVQIGPQGVAGDAQADLENHGGVDKAVLAYSADHYPWWQARLGLTDIPYGGFGENLTIAGLEEHGVCVGDIWQAGEVTLQVSQPRQPCWKMSRRWQIADLARQVIQNGRSGWYLRVRSPGTLTAPAPIELVERPHPAWTVARASELMHHRQNDLASAAELAALPRLSAAWRESLLARIAKRESTPSH